MQNKVLRRIKNIKSENSKANSNKSPWRINLIPYPKPKKENGSEKRINKK